MGFGIRKWGEFDVGEEMEECVFHGVELHGSQTEGVLVLVFFLGSRQWRKLWWRRVRKF